MTQQEKISNFANKNPVLAILILALFSAGGGSGTAALFGFNAYASDEILAEAKEYTDNSIKQVMTQIDTRITRLECSDIKYQYMTARKDLFELKEREKVDPNKDRRKIISDLEGDITLMESKLTKCK